MERSRKIISLLERCSDSEDTKQMIKEMHQEMEQKQLQKNGRKIRGKGETKQ